MSSLTSLLFPRIVLVNSDDFFFQLSPQFLLGDTARFLFWWDLHLGLIRGMLHVIQDQDIFLFNSVIKLLSFQFISFVFSYVPRNYSLCLWVLTVWFWKFVQTAVGFAWYCTHNVIRLAGNCRFVASLGNSNCMFILTPNSLISFCPVIHCPNSGCKLPGHLWMWSVKERLPLSYYWF